MGHPAAFFLIALEQWRLPLKGAGHQRFGLLFVEPAADYDNQVQGNDNIASGSSYQ